MHFVVSGFFSKVDENCAVVGYFAASGGGLLLKLQMGPIVCPETTVRLYRYSLYNNPEEHSSHFAFCWLSVVNWLF